MSPINGDKIQGSPNLENDNVVSGPQRSTNSLQTQLKMMKWAVAKCPIVNITIMSENMPSLLNSGSMVSLMWQTYFNRYFRTQLGPAEGAVAEAHNLFDWKKCQWWRHTLVKICWVGCWIFRVESAQGQILDHPESKWGVRPWTQN